MAIKRLIIEEIKKGRKDPNLSHKNPVIKEPDINARLVVIVKIPIAEPRCSSGIKSDTQALAIPSVDVA